MTTQRKKVKLSLRIRPNSEAAPWVVEEVKKLEQELQSINDHMEACRQLLNVPDNEVLYQTIEELKDRVDHLEKHPKGCDCIECSI